MTWLVAILIRRGLSSRLAGVLAWLIPATLLVILALVLWFTAAHWLTRQRTDAVTSYQKDVTIEAANRVIAAERAATTNQTANAATFANAQEELHDTVREKGTAGPVGPGVQSVLDRMRQQQAAGRR